MPASHGGRDRGGSAVPGKLGEVERNKRRRLAARRHPQVGGPGSGGGLTRFEPSAYRWPVTRCRPVPHVHEGSFLVVGERCQPMRHAADPRPVQPLRPSKEITREQAHLSAEQPTPAQGPRIPPAHAHPCRSRDPLLASPQGPHQARRLSRGGSARSCYPGRTGSRRAATSVARRVMEGEPGPAPSSPTSW